MKQTKKNQNRTQKKQNPIQTPPRKNEKRAKKKQTKAKLKANKSTPQIHLSVVAFSSLFFRFFLDIFLTISNVMVIRSPAKEKNAKIRCRKKAEQQPKKGGKSEERPNKKRNGKKANA